MAVIETSLSQMRGERGSEGLYDWMEVWRHANGETTQQGTKHTPEPVPGTKAKAERFGVGDVKTLLGSVNGENDGPDWVCYGELKDGRYFAIRAGCDYTGWNCQAGGESVVADTQEQIETLGLNRDERVRLGIAPSSRLVATLRETQEAFELEGPSVTKRCYETVMQGFAEARGLAENLAPATPRPEPAPARLPAPEPQAPGWMLRAQGQATALSELRRDLQNAIANSETAGDHTLGSGLRVALDLVKGKLRRLPPAPQDHTIMEEWRSAKPTTP